MTDSSLTLPSSMTIVGEDGKPTIEFITLWDELINGRSAQSIGTIVSGISSVTAKADGIVDGTQPLADVVITGRGSVSSALDANADTISEAGTASGDLSVSASPAYASGTRSGAGSVTTSSITFSVSNGTGPYTGVFSKVSGDDFTAASTTFSGATLATTFSRTISSGAFDNAQYKLTVTDTSDSSTASVNFSLSAYDEAGIS